MLHNCNAPVTRRSYKGAIIISKTPFFIYPIGTAALGWSRFFCAGLFFRLQRDGDRLLLPVEHPVLEADLLQSLLHELEILADASGMMRVRTE